MKAINAAGNMRSLSYCMDKAAEQGYTANFQVTGLILNKVGTGLSYAPHQVHIVDYFRFEGQSDPDDNAILYIIETNDGSKGTIADAYGIYANRQIGDFFVEVDDIHKKKPTME